MYISDIKIHSLGILVCEMNLTVVFLLFPFPGFLQSIVCSLFIYLSTLVVNSRWSLLGPENVLIFQQTGDPYFVCSLQLHSL